MNFFIAVFAALWIWETILYVLKETYPVLIEKSTLTHSFLVAGIGFALTRDLYSAMAIAGLIFVLHTVLDRISTYAIPVRRRRL